MNNLFNTLLIWLALAGIALGQDAKVPTTEKLDSLTEEARETFAAQAEQIGEVRQELRLLQGSIDVLAERVSQLEGSDPPPDDGNDTEPDVDPAAENLSFRKVDPGITEQIEASRGEDFGNWWSCSITAVPLRGDNQPLDLYLNQHQGSVDALIYRKGDDGTWRDVTSELVPEVDSITMPRENRPVFADFDNDGRIDIVPTGDESDGVGLRNTGDTLVPWGYTAKPATKGVVAEHLNNDEYIDVIKRDRRNWGESYVMRFINDPENEQFEYSRVKAEIPDDLPQHLQDELRELESLDESGNRYGGPMYWRGDLNGDDREDCIVQYYSSYGGGPRFGRYLFRDADGNLVDKTDTCGIPANLTPLLPPKDTDGDGRLDLICGYGSTDEAGHYRQVDGDQFELHRVDGKSIHQTNDVVKSVYNTTGAYLYQIRWRDFDADGDHDLFVSKMRLGSFLVYENRGGELHRVSNGRHADAEGWDICDIDGDGDEDIVSYGKGNDHSDVTVSFYLNMSGEGATEPTVSMITPETIEELEAGGSHKRYVLGSGVYQPFTLDGVENVHVECDGPVLVKGDTALHGHTVTVNESSDVTLSGLTTTGGNAGIAVYRSDNITVSGCTSHDNKNWGIFTSLVDDFTADGNRCINNVGEHGIYVSNDCVRPTLTDNVCSGNGKSGIQCNGDQGVVSDATITGNVLIGNRIGMNMDGLVDSRIEGNAMVGSLRLFRVDAAEGSSRNQVTGNMVALSSDKDSHALWLRNDAQENVLDGNLLYVPKSLNPWSHPLSHTGQDFVSRRNIYWSPGQPVGGGEHGKEPSGLVNDTGSIAE